MLTDVELGNQGQAPGTGFAPSSAEVYATAAGFYVALLKNRYFDEAADFAEWFLDEFDLDLESGWSSYRDR